jgi:3-hydroxybutyryl-CoA dehydrogenase
MKIKTVGIVGSGTMGSGIAQACAVSGLSVVMVDISQEALDKGMKTIAHSLERLLSKEKITPQDQSRALSLIQTSTQYL